MLSPAFAVNNKNYTASVSSGVQTLMVTPTANDPGALVVVNGLQGGTSFPVPLIYGINMIPVQITSVDGTVTNSYTIAVTRLPGDATLASLNINNRTLSPVFSKNIKNYAVTVNGGDQFITLAATATDPLASIMVNGAYNPNGSISLPVPLNYGVNYFDVQVTSSDGALTNTYTVAVTRPANDATLANISLSDGVISPAFNSLIKNYMVTVPGSVQMLMVTPTANDQNASVFVYGNYIPPGAPYPVPLNYGTNAIQVRVTSVDGSVSNTYSLLVFRLANDATLANLTLSDGTLSPVFSANITNYTATVGGSVQTLTLAPSANDPNASVTVNGNYIPPGAAFPVSLNYGSNAMQVRVTSVDGTASRTYNLLVNRLANDATLANLALSDGALSPVFSANITNYTATVGGSVQNIAFMPFANDPQANVTVNGSAVFYGNFSPPFSLSYGANNFSVAVTAPDGTTKKNYNVAVTRLSDDATLSNLAVSAGKLSPVFSSANLNYADTVANAVTSLTLTPTLSNFTSTVTVNGINVASGSASASIPVAIGTYKINVVGKAQDGTQKTYTIKLTRLSNYSALTSLIVSQGRLSPAFITANLNYTDTVANTVSGLTVTPTLSNTTSTMTVNGIPLASGAVSPVIPLAVGANDVTILLKAQDGSLKTYSLKVIRVPAKSALLNLTVSQGKLSPAFAITNLNYTDTIANAVTGLTITPVIYYAGATVTVNGTTVASGSPVSIPVAIGTYNIYVIVKATDGTSSTYTIKVTRLSNYSALTSLIVSQGKLSPVFTTGNLNYTDTVANTVSGLTVTPTLSNTTSTMTVNGTSVASGAASANIPVVVGLNNITILLKAQDGTLKTYTVTVFRLPAKSALLNLTVSQGKLSPLFVNTNFIYTDTVANAITSLNVTPVVYYAGATVTINGTQVASGSPATIPVAVGTYNINVIVKAADGTSGTYVIKITRLSNYAALTSLIVSQGKLSPVFTTANLNYTDTLANAVTSLTVTPTLSNTTSTVTVNGVAVASGSSSASIPVAVGTYNINIVAKAQDGTLKTYIIKVTRLSNYSALTSLIVSQGKSSPVFTTANLNYTDTLANAVSGLTVTPTLSNTTSTVTVNGISVASGTASAVIPIAVGLNNITILLKAQDGTPKTYSIVVKRLTPAGLNSIYTPGTGSNATPLIAALSNEKVIANNILSPNGDGINDIWVVKNIAFYPDNRVNVYDQSGKVVFTTKNYANNWDGSYHGSVIKEGTYFYLIELGNGKIEKGFITVVSDR